MVAKALHTTGALGDILNIQNFGKISTTLSKASGESAALTQELRQLSLSR